MVFSKSHITDGQVDDHVKYDLDKPTVWAKAQKLGFFYSELIGIMNCLE